MNIKKYVSQSFALMSSALLMTSCEGLFSGVYDDPVEEIQTVAGQLYIDASDWHTWYYLDLDSLTEKVAEDSDYDTSLAWTAMAIPQTEVEDGVDSDQAPGIYTYWYDIYGQGLSNHEFRSFMPTDAQPEPDSWTLAVHRNNLRTNGAAMAMTECLDIDQLPLTANYLSTLDFRADTWNESDVWVEQGRMLLGLIGNQGIKVNEVGSSWLKIDIPPTPPSFEMNSRVMVIRTKDGKYGAIQLVDYLSPSGTKCCLTINYRYPLQFD